MKDRHGEGQDRTIYSKPSVQETSFLAQIAPKNVWWPGSARTAGELKRSPSSPNRSECCHKSYCQWFVFKHKSQNELADGNIKQKKRDRLTESRNIFTAKCL